MAAGLSVGRLTQRSDSCSLTYFGISDRFIHTRMDKLSGLDLILHDRAIMPINYGDTQIPGKKSGEKRKISETFCHSGVKQSTPEKA
jgi:hypothetical protein